MVSQSKDSESEILKSYGTQSRQRQYEETGGTTQKSGTTGLKETQAKNGEITGRFHHRYDPVFGSQEVLDLEWAQARSYRS